MKRRSLVLLAGTSLATLKFGFSKAQSAADPALLTTTLTPMGSERAGNADGSIPAWTGGLTTVPAGWTENDPLPNFFSDEQPLLVIDASNMSQHQDRLTEGVMAMMTKYGFSIKVYPTHRTHACPQWVYDNTAKNLQTAKLDPAGGRFGFTGAYGGYPFPIPDLSDPFAAGAQIMSNFQARWPGEGYTINREEEWVVINGTPTALGVSTDLYMFPYYQKDGSLATYGGLYRRIFVDFTAPTNLTGENIIEWQYTDETAHPDQDWELLQGQGRVRRAPELEFDTPDSFTDGIDNFDESYGFLGSMIEYDWKYIEKKEMYIPYNTNGVVRVSALTDLKPHFINPDIARWELHRVWVVEATLHPGYRNVLARRRFYYDEDSWIIVMDDTWDANGNLFHVGTQYTVTLPNAPGVFTNTTVVNNLQTGNYSTPIAIWDQQTPREGYHFKEAPTLSKTDPQNMAAGSQY